MISYEFNGTKISAKLQSGRGIELLRYGSTLVEAGFEMESVEDFIDQHGHLLADYASGSHRLLAHPFSEKEIRFMRDCLWAGANERARQIAERDAANASNAEVVR